MAVVSQPTSQADARWARFAPALGARNFRLFWLGQLISVVGTSVQVVAEGWLIYDLTGSTFWLGMAGLLGLLPVLPVSLIGGLIIDRVQRQAARTARPPGGPRAQGLAAGVFAEP